MSGETSKGVEILGKAVKQEKENKSNLPPHEQRNKQRGGNSGKLVK